MREPLGARQLLGLLCGMGGVAWIMAGRSGGASALDHKAWLGVGMILAGALALAASTLYNRRAAIASSALAHRPPATLGQQPDPAAAGAVDGRPAAQPTPLVLASLAYQSHRGVGWHDADAAVAGAPRRRRQASSFHLLNPLFGVLLAAALLGETVTLSDVMGGAADLAGLGLVVRR